MTWTPIGKPFTTDEGATFTPVIDKDTRVIGYTVEAKNLPAHVIFLNPSSSQDDNELLSTDFFVYVEDTDANSGTADKSLFLQVWDDLQDEDYHERRRTRNFE